MKKFTSFFCTTLGLLVLTLTACKKEHITVTPPAQTSKISKLEIDGDTMEAAYHSDGSVKAITTKQTGGTMVTNYIFNYVDGKIKEIDFGGKWRYIYIGNKITSVETVNPNGEVKYKSDFVYNNDRVIEKTDFLVRTAGTFPFYRTRLYYNTAGNVVKKELFDYVNHDWKKAEEILITEYDTKPNTAQHFENYPYLPLNLFSVNNPVRESYVNDMGVTNASVVHAYIYDASGRPVRRKTTYAYIGFPDTFSEATFHY